MAGMVPEKRSRGQIERANQELLERNRAHMKRWLDRVANAPEQAEGSKDQSDNRGDLDDVRKVNFA